MGIIAQIYTDIASAYKRDAKRPEFQNALDDLKAGRIDGIAVWKLDRLARRMTETYGSSLNRVGGVSVRR
jgi:DNA invertase Pin-like site-specific DNA recombinase